MFLNSHPGNYDDDSHSRYIGLKELGGLASRLHRLAESAT